MIKTIGTKTLFNLDNGAPLNKWIKKNPITKSFPKLTSALKISETNYGTEMTDKGFATLVSNSNNVYENTQAVYIVNGGITRNVGNVKIDSDNFMKAMAIFTARKTIKRNWINWQDEYLAPNTEHEDYEQWNNDAIIYSLFNGKSNQSSLRDVEYKGETWQIENEFFFMSHEEIKELADKYSNGECYNDVKQYGKDRYVYKLLSSLSLSDDAKEVLEMAKDMVRRTFEYRELMNEEHPEYNLQAWDTGWYQIKLIAKEYCKDELKKFNEKYKEFENRMRDGVYTFEFLRK